MKMLGTCVTRSSSDGRRRLGHHVVLSLLLVCFLVHSQDAQVMEVADVGGDALMRCHAREYGNNNRPKHIIAVWKKVGNDELMSVGTTVMERGSRFRIVRRTSKEWSLWLKDVHMSDFGAYMCIIYADMMISDRFVITLKHVADPTPPKDIWLKPTRPTIPPSQHEHVSVNADVGGDALMPCHAREYDNNNRPSHIIAMWKKDRNDELVSFGTAVEERSHRFWVYRNTSTDWSLFLKDVRMLDFGDYKCIIYADMMISDIFVITLKPSKPTAPYVYYTDKKRNGQELGVTIEIRCSAIGMPLPLIHWRRHGDVIARKHHKYWVTDVTTGTYSVTSTLKIRSLVNDNYGEYECVGENDLGQQRITLEVYNSDP